MIYYWNKLLVAIYSWIYTEFDFAKKVWQQVMILIKRITSLVMGWLHDLFVPIIGPIFTEAAGMWDLLNDYAGQISYFFPVYTMLGVVLGAYSAVTSIRIIRWLLSAIPRAFTGAD